MTHLLTILDQLKLDFHGVFEKILRQVGFILFMNEQQMVNTKMINNKIWKDKTRNSKFC